MVLLENLTGMEQATSIASRILEALEAPVRLNGDECQISCSIGISLFPQDGHTADELVRKADLAMYEAKSGGKNAFRLFSNCVAALSLQEVPGPSLVPSEPKAGGPQVERSTRSDSSWDPI